MAFQSNYTQKPLDQMSSDEMSYLIDYTDRISHAYITTANSSFSEANKTEQDLGSQLMLLNTVILSASLLALGNGDLLNLLTNPHRIMICIILGFQTMSIIAGIASYKLREYFFAKAGENATLSAKIAKKREYKTLSDLDQHLRMNDSKQANQSGGLAVNLQITLIAISLLIFTVLVFTLLFDVPCYNN